MENNEILNEEEVQIVTFTDEDGNDSSFEYLDVVEYQGKEYLVLQPVEEENAEIVILEVVPVDEETEDYITVEDMETLTAVYEIFKERFKDIFTFVD